MWLGKALGGVLALSAQGVEPDPTQGVQAAFWTEGDGPAQGQPPGTDGLLVRTCTECWL